MLSVLSGKVVVMITDSTDTYAAYILLYIAAPLKPKVYRLDEWFRRSGIFVKIL